MKDEAWKVLSLVVCLQLLAACSQGTVQPARLAVATITPVRLAPAASAPTSTPVVSVRFGAEVEAARAAAAAGDFERAVGILAPIASANRDSAALAGLLAGHYIGWGRAILGAEPQQAGAARAAFDAFVRAAEVAPAGSEVARRAAVERDVAQALLDTWAALDELLRLAGAAAPPAERERAAQRALDESARAADTLPELPGVREARAAALVGAARLQQALGLAQQGRAERERRLALAAEWCGGAASLWPADAPQGEAARGCLAELRRQAAPPPTPRPTGGAQPAARGRVFGAIPQRAFPPGPHTEQRLSCVAGAVVRADGSPVAGAVGNVNNAAAFLSWTTDGEGRYSVCGLGWSNWAVVLDYIPDRPGLARQSSIGGVWLDGTAEQQALIVFKQQR
jgi:hypothetical protein